MSLVSCDLVRLESSESSNTSSIHAAFDVTSLSTLTSFPHQHRSQKCVSLGTMELYPSFVRAHVNATYQRPLEATSTPHLGHKKAHSMPRRLPKRPLPTPDTTSHRPVSPPIQDTCNTSSPSSSSTTPSTSPTLTASNTPPRKARSLPVPPPFPMLSPTTCTTPLRIHFHEDSDAENDGDQVVLDWDLLDEILCRHIQDTSVDEDAFD